jgi:di/tricarboxylate transporter
VNTLVVGPGNYTFGDFLKVGVPLSLAVLAVSVLLVPIILPL